MSGSGASGASDQDTAFFGHPRGLATLFFTEMWERFSYYGMRALLVLFMTDSLLSSAEDPNGAGMGLSKADATAVFGLYAFAVYALSLPGGWIADRLLGQRKSVLYGGVVIALGHFVLAIPNSITFYSGLVLVALGTGLLKPNVSSIVGDLYTDKGARRDAGFSLFYMGINLGAWLGPLVCSWLGEKVSWHLGFGAAGVGMSLAVVQYILGRGHLSGAGEPRDDALNPERRALAMRQLAIGVGAISILVIGLVVVNRTGILPFSLAQLAEGQYYVVTAVAVLYFAYVILGVCETQEERQRVGLIALLFVGAAFFWSGFEQAASTMNLFAKELTDLHILDYEIPAGWMQQVNPIFIILLAPVMGLVWLRLGTRSPTVGMKFALGLLFLGAGFFVLAWGASFTTGGAKVSPMWLVVCYFFHTVGELCLSPVGLSAVTKLAPDRLLSQMMGTWFMGAALGNLVAGVMGSELDKKGPTELFTMVGWIAIGAMIIFVVLAGPMKRLAGSVR